MVDVCLEEGWKEYLRQHRHRSRSSRTQSLASIPQDQKSGKWDMHMSVDINGTGNIMQHKKRGLCEGGVELQVHEHKEFQRLAICDNRMYVLQG